MIAKVALVNYQVFGLTHKIEEFYQLVLWDVDDFTDHGALSSYIEKSDSEEAFSICHPHPSNMKFVQYISSKAPGDMIFTKTTIFPCYLLR